MSNLLHISWRRFEEFLRFDQTTPIADRAKLRASYGIGFAFSAIQLCNLVGMTITYGGWTFDHWIAVAAITALMLTVLLIRYVKNHSVYAMIYLLLAMTGVFMSSIPDHTGINSALLPMLVMLPMIIAFISGFRMTLISGGLSLLTIIILYYDSLFFGPGDLVVFGASIMQRALQASFFVMLVTGIAMIFSQTIFQSLFRLEEALERAHAAERAKGAFLATMSHELRTPLNGVLGLTTALQATKLDDEQRFLTRTIDQSGRSLLTILNDILDLSKIDAEKLEINPVTFSPVTMINDVADVWRATLIQKGLELKVEIDSEMAQTIISDEFRLRQIISNFISNAVKFTEKGSVTIRASILSTASDSDLLLVSVADTGLGIPADKADQVFRPFEQVDASTTRRFGGSGLGLTICESLAKLMEGKVWFDSEAGKGATFSVQVPVEIAAAAELTNSELEVCALDDAPAKQSAHAESTVQASISGGPAISKGAVEAEDAPANAREWDQPEQGARALIVEDNLVNQLVLVRMLERLGMLCDIAANGEECLERLEDADYDLVLLDKHMPVMDGIETLKAIRALGESLASMPVIACTADAMSGEREAMLELGFDDFVSKPIDIESLSIAVNRCLKRAQAA